MPELHSASANQAIHLGVYIQVREFAAFGLRSHSYGSLHFFISIWVTMGKSLLIILITAYEIAGEVGRVACYVPSQRFVRPKICKGSSPENFSLKKDRKQCSRKVRRQVQSLSLCSGQTVLISWVLFVWHLCHSLCKLMLILTSQMFWLPLRWVNPRNQMLLLTNGSKTWFIREEFELMLSPVPWNCDCTSQIAFESVRYLTQALALANLL